MPQLKKKQEYTGDKYKIRSVLLSIAFLFLALVVIDILLYIFNNPVMAIGTSLLLDLTRIIFIILVTPVAILTLFIGHRIDNERNKSNRYPLWLELTGLILGFFFGWALSVEWALLLTIKVGIIWSDPFLYAPFPIFTPLLTYLCFKTAQFIYAKKHPVLKKERFIIPFIFLILSIPIFGYSASAIGYLLQQEALQNQVMVTNIMQVPMGEGYQIKADISVPEDNLYHITAQVSDTPHATSALALRLNGVANLDRLYNFELTKGVNRFTFTPSPLDCSNTKHSSEQTTLTINVSKMLADRFTIAQPHTFKTQITCR